jgi:predicted ferric reductase
MVSLAKMVAAQTATTNSTSTTNAATSAAASAATIKDEANNANEAFHKYIYFICAGLVVGLAVWRIVIESTKYVRTLTCLNNPTQTFFMKPSQTYAAFKDNLLYAPIFRKRHNREFQLSSAINMGTLPTRFQFMFLVLYFGTNIAFCVVSIHWDQTFVSVAREVRNRTGILAVVNMVPLFVMASRNNPLISWLNMSFDTFNLLHRWFGRVVVLETLAHTGAWMAATYTTGGWAAITKQFSASPMIMWGLIGTVAATAISIQAMSVLRHAFYETFKYLHIALAALFLVGGFYHLHLDQLVQVNFLYACMGIWVLERLSRVARVMYRNVGSGGTKAVVEALPGNAVRVTLDLARPWTFRPGQHAYLYMPSIGLWTSHPFSVAWSQEAERPDEKKGLAMSRQDILAMQKTSMSFVIRARTGFTAKLYKKAAAAPEGRISTRCFAEGPYGGEHKMHSYGTVMLIAGGVGITHQVPHVRDLVAGFGNATVATRRVVLVWIIQSPEHLEWIRPWMTEILAMDKRRDILRIMLFVSRPRSTKEIHSPSATVQMFPGRPNIETLLDMEIEGQVGAMGVTVCGSGALSDDVRCAVRSRQHVSNIDFIEEAFSW